MLRIGELAQVTSVNKSAIDHYTRLGLIEPACRSDGSYRLYSQDTVERIKFIKQCQEKRLSLEEIQAIIRTGGSPEDAGVRLCMASATMALDEALRELEDVSMKLGDAPSPAADAITGQAAAIMAKAVAISQLLQSMLAQI